MKKRNRKLISALLVFAFVFYASFVNGTPLLIKASAEQYSGTCGTNLNWSLDTDTGVLKITGSGNMENFSSKAPWYSYSDKITAVNISNSVTSIGNNAFSGLNKITGITLPSNLTEIGSYAFGGCSGIQELSLPSSLKTIGESAFSGMRIESITIPAKVTSIGFRVLKGCIALSSITVNSQNTIYKASGNCLIDKTTKTLIAGCKSSVIPSDGSVTSIGEYAFAESVYISDINIPSCVTSIKDYAFDSNTSIRSLTLSEGLVSIGDYAFDGCFNVKNFTIPSTVTTIGNRAFSQMLYVTSLKVPAKVSSIGEAAFQGNERMTSLTVDGNNTVYYSKNNCIIHKASKTLIATCDSSVIPSDGSVTKIGNHSLEARYSEYISIPSGITSIGDYAFGSCSKLTDITIPEGVKSIGNYAFYNCRSLEYVNLPNSLETLGDSAFRLCRALTGIIIGDNIKAIGECVFMGCSGMQDVIIGEKVESIGYNAFSSCSGLTSLTIPDSVKTIGTRAFAGCSSLTTIYLGSGVKTIDTFAFVSCNKLADVYYSGTKEQRNDIDIHFTNSDTIVSATWHYTEVYYFLTYNANGGYDEPAEQYGYGTITLSTAKPTKENSTFLGWATSAGATSAQYQPGASFNLTKDTVLYAVWKNNGGTQTTYTLTYNANGGTGGPGRQTGYGNITLSTAKPTKANSTFLGWATSAGAASAQYQPGANFSLTRDITLYAVWRTNGSPSNPTAGASLRVRSSATVDYKSVVTITATAIGVPEGYYLAIYEGDALRGKGDNTSVSYKAGTMTASKTFTVKVIDAGGNVQKDANGNDLAATCEVKVKSGFFDKLIAFFKSLFGSMPKVEIKP